MKKTGFVFLLVVALMLTGLSACAEEIDITGFTYDELSALRDEIDQRMEELRRQYAIENGNRTIALDCESLTLFVKQKQQVTASVERVVEDAPEKTSVVWSSSDESIATVSSDGRITAVAEGNAVITCAAEDDEYIFATLPVSVVLRVADVTVSPTEEITLRLSDVDLLAREVQLTALIVPENAFCQSVRWISSDETIVSVDEFGLIRALKPGNVTITATSNEEVSGDLTQKKGIRKVTVVQDVASIELDQSQLKIKKGSTAKLTATVLPESASNKKVSWESSDEAVVKVSAGQLTASGCGTCIITCRSTDGSEVYASCEVEVYQPVSSIKLDQTTLNAYIGMEPVQIVATIAPDDATDQTLVWSSSDPSVATVDENGFVTAVAGGTCEIECKACDGSDKSVKATILVPSISVEQEAYEVTEKSGLRIPIQFFGKDINDLSVAVADKTILKANLNTKGIIEVQISPEKAGKTTITLKDASSSKNSVKLSITVASSAVYDSKSYPKASYEDILRYPDKHNGENIQIYGKVLQKMESSSFVVLRVGTTGRYYDSVFYVTYFMDDTMPSVIEDDFVTIYGSCSGTKTYETIMGGSVTIPSMYAEKIIVGKKK